MYGMLQFIRYEHLTEFVMYANKANGKKMKEVFFLQLFFSFSILFSQKQVFLDYQEQVSKDYS